MSISAIQGFQQQPIKQTHAVEENLEPISSALKTIIKQYSDAKGAAPELKGRTGYPESTSYIEKCDKLYKERI